jgi:hypothetical protein
VPSVTKKNTGEVRAHSSTADTKRQKRKDFMGLTGIEWADD